MRDERLELWFDFSCPYAYLASQKAPGLARAAGVELAWKPMLLGGVFRGIGAGDGPMATLGAAKAAHNLRDMQRWAQVFGVPFQMPAAHPMRTVRALRVLLGLAEARWPAAIAGIYAAYWQRAEDITRDEVIAGALRGCAPEAEITAAFAGAESDAIKAELRRRTDEAIGHGIFGAPGWIVRGIAGAASNGTGGIAGDGAASNGTGGIAGEGVASTGTGGIAGEGAASNGTGTLIWGQDRLAWVEAALAGWDFNGPPPGGPRPFGRDVEPFRSPHSLEVYFDVASPFAYFALTQLPALARVTGTTPVLHPILLGGLFRDIGQTDVPLLSWSDAKRRYTLAEMDRWSQWWGVPFEMPRKFPQRTITAQRLCVLAGNDAHLAIALARAMWAEQRDLEDPDTLRAILDEVGLPRAWVERTAEPEIKAALIANSATAKAAGVFGVPSFVVGGKHLVWGQDRLDLVMRFAAGWDAP